MGCVFAVMISKTDFKTINDIWSEFLWPSRISKIESHSAMLLDGTYDIKNFDNEPTFLLFIDQGKIAGCNSGHLCSDNTYRSRGLYVFPEYRKKGIGKELLKSTINIGIEQQANLIWSYPRYESWSTYSSAGFTLAGQWEKSETGINTYCILKV